MGGEHTYNIRETESLMKSQSTKELRQACRVGASIKTHKKLVIHKNEMLCQSKDNVWHYRYYFYTVKSTVPKKLQLRNK